ncbi:hypothetical protein M0R45_032135 [Rubus argutus]|uniref:Uncharacterized protein n=1 Tax=Rubus argutus TaxID=59490 RepID=A0AAW1WIJ5_RUBAR
MVETNIEPEPQVTILAQYHQQDTINSPPTYPTCVKYIEVGGLRRFHGGGGCITFSRAQCLSQPPATQAYCPVPAITHSITKAA